MFMVQLLVKFRFFIQEWWERKSTNIVWMLTTDVSIPVNPPPFRGSLPCKSLISRMDWVSCAGDINLPHTPFLPPNKKIKYNKSWPTFCDQYFWKFPIWNSRSEEKRREIRMVKVDVIFNDIRLLICLTPLQVNWVMVIN
jgi:hypothetical protein